MLGFLFPVSCILYPDEIITQVRNPWQCAAIPHLSSFFTFPSVWVIELIDRRKVAFQFHVTKIMISSSFNWLHFPNMKSNEGHHVTVREPLLSINNNMGNNNKIISTSVIEHWHKRTKRKRVGPRPPTDIPFFSDNFKSLVNIGFHNHMCSHNWSFQASLAFLTTLNLWVKSVFTRVDHIRLCLVCLCLCNQVPQPTLWSDFQVSWRIWLVCVCVCFDLYCICTYFDDWLVSTDNGGFRVNNAKDHTGHTQPTLKKVKTRALSSTFYGFLRFWENLF